MDGVRQWAVTVMSLARDGCIHSATCGPAMIAQKKVRGKSIRETCTGRHAENANTWYTYLGSIPERIASGKIRCSSRISRHSQKRR